MVEHAASSSPSEYEVEDDDLLCSTSAQTHDGQNGLVSRASLVYLRLESATALETKIARGVVFFVTLASFLILVALVVLKTVYEHAFNAFETDSFQITNIVLGSVCLVALTVRSTIFAVRCVATIRRGQLWKPRRRRVATFAAVGACVQLINLICWIVPNAYIMARFLHCPWLSRVASIAGSVRWVMWNCTLLLYLINGTSLLAWNPKTDPLRWLWSRKAATPQPEYLLVLDAPIWHHLNKAPIWLTWTGGVLGPLSAGYAGSAEFHVPNKNGLSPEDCLHWDWGPACVADGLVKVIPIFIMALSAIYLFWYLGAMALVYRQLLHKPFAAYRAANILFQLQLRSMLLTYKMLVLSTGVLWFFKENTCLSFVTTWLGMLPMQLVATALAWHNLFVYMPKDPEHAPMLQAWLQEVAWTEAELPKQLAQRNSRATSPREAAQLQREPMFCYETALKLLKWSSLTYTDFGQAPPEPGGQLNCSTGDRLGGRTSGLRLHAPCRWRPPSSGSGGTRISNAQGTASTAGDDELASQDMSPCDEADEGSGSDSSTHSGHASLSRPESDDPYTASTLQGSEVSSSLRQVVVARHDLKRPKGRRRRESTKEVFQTAMALYDLTDVQPFYDQVADVKALLAWNRQRVVLAFRGTASMTNAWSDLQVWRTAHHRAAPSAIFRRSALVHAGFHRAWVANGLHQQVIQHLQELYKSGAIDAEAVICVTGHSLGGALAVLAAHDIAAELKPYSMQCYSFGCPYVGNHLFAQHCEASVRDTWHIVNDRDIIPRSGKFLFLFKRPGHRVHVDMRGDMLVRPSALELQVRHGKNMSHHLLRAYRSALVAVLLAQFSDRGNSAHMKQALQLCEAACVRDELAKDGVDWHKLRRTTQWGSTGSARRVPAPQACSGHFMGRPHRMHAAPISAAQMRLDNSPGISLASLQHFRSTAVEAAQSS